MIKKLKLGGHSKQKKSEYDIVIGTKSNFYNLQLPLNPIEDNQRSFSQLSRRKSAKNPAISRNSRKLSNFTDGQTNQKMNIVNQPHLCSDLRI